MVPGVGVTKCNRAEIKHMVQMHRNGLTIKQIASQYRHNNMTVARWLRMYDKYGEEFFAKR